MAVANAHVEAEDSLRAIPSLLVPSDEELDSFDAFMKGPLD